MQPILRKLTTDQKAVLIQVLVAFPIEIKPQSHLTPQE
jgi:hypothetical protein